MMTFADGWGWASWLVLALIMLMFVIVVGGVGVMFWASERASEQPPAENEQDATPGGRTADTPPAA
jgi:flagellar basal body-associated protein FliL